MSTFINKPAVLNFYAFANCPKCAGVGLVSDTKRTAAGDAFKVTIRFCDCATMFTRREA